MIFNQHSELEGRHAPLSASKPYWLNYDEERMLDYVDNLSAARRGTQLHELASMAIRLGVKLPNTSQTLNLYVNECIGFRMKPEQPLYFSPVAFGTADAISFRDNVLRIFDLKTGRSKATEQQLKIYAAYFCLEYKVNPMAIEYDLRIYQDDAYYMIEFDPVEIVYIMERAKEASTLVLDRLREEG